MSYLLLFMFYAKLDFIRKAFKDNVHGVTQGNVCYVKQYYGLM